MELSVVIPTYNRAELLAYTLRALAAQRFDPNRFEVIVADDGSTDNTVDIVREFEGRLRLSFVRLWRNVDEVARLGYCVSRVRNRGAAVATAPVLVFIDAGVIAGPDFLSAHLAEHRAARPGTTRMVAGYAYGTEKLQPLPTRAELLRTRAPEEVRDAIAGEPQALDARHSEFARPAQEVAGMAGTWQLGWSLNLSLPAEVFCRVGGMDESFRGWGCEDLEFAFRVARHGSEVTLSDAAWVVEWPTPVDVASVEASADRNFRRFLAKHRHPDLEIWFSRRSGMTLDGFQEDHDVLRAWTDAARAYDVSAELTVVQSEYGTLPARVVVIGCGAALPEHWQPAVGFDFDATMVRSASADTRHTALHGIGVVTGQLDDAFDLVVVTSRLSGLWTRWGEEILAEAHRIGGQVRVPFLAAVR